MSVVPSLSSLTVLLLLVGRVGRDATQGKCFLVLCMGKELGAAEMRGRSSLGKCRRLCGNGGETLKGKQKWGSTKVDNFTVERLILLQVEAWICSFVFSLEIGMLMTLVIQSSVLSLRLRNCVGRILLEKTLIC